MDEEQKNEEVNVTNEETKVETTNVEVKEEPVVQETNPPVEQAPVTSNVSTKKGGNKLVPIIVGLVLVAAIFAGLFFCTDIFKGKKSNEGGEEAENKKDDSPAGKFEGIYTAENNNMYIHKKTDTEIYYTIGGNFQGTAKVEGDIAKEANGFGATTNFEFKLVDDGIELIYSAGENESVATDVGKYKKVADYSKDNVYKYAVGDKKYLSEKYSGVYKNGDATFYVIQKNEKDVMVILDADFEADLPLFNEKFEVASDNKLIAKSFFNENETSYEITFNGKEFTLKANKDVFGVSADASKLEKTYTFSKALTQEEVLNEFYSYY
jgi:archaellin